MIDIAAAAKSFSTTVTRIDPQTRATPKHTAEHGQSRVFARPASLRRAKSTFFYCIPTTLLHSSFQDPNTPLKRTMFSRIATSSVRVAAKGVRHATTVSAQGGKNEFKALRDATKAHAAGEFVVQSLLR